MAYAKDRTCVPHTLFEGFLMTHVVPTSLQILNMIWTMDMTFLSSPNIHIYANITERKTVVLIFTEPSGLWAISKLTRDKRDVASYSAMTRLTTVFTLNLFPLISLKLAMVLKMSTVNFYVNQYQRNWCTTRYFVIFRCLRHLPRIEYTYTLLSIL